MGHNLEEEGKDACFLAFLQLKSKKCVVFLYLALLSQDFVKINFHCNSSFFGLETDIVACSL